MKTILTYGGGVHPPLDQIKKIKASVNSKR